MVPRLVGLVRDDGLCARLGRDPPRGPLFILNGVALLATVVVFRDEFIAGRDTIVGYGGVLAC